MQDVGHCKGGGSFGGGGRLHLEVLEHLSHINAAGRRQSERQNEGRGEWGVSANLSTTR